jgi:hypothetical protein
MPIEYHKLLRDRIPEIIRRRFLYLLTEAGLPAR